MAYNLLPYLMVFPLLISPLKTIESSRVTIVVTTDKIHDTTFVRHDLEVIMDQPGAASIILRMVTCPLSHEPLVDEMLELMGDQHMAAFAVDGSGAILTGSAIKVALPCPPDCGPKREKVTVADFLASR